MKKTFLAYILITIIILSSFLFISNKKVYDSNREIVFWTLQLGTFDKYINKTISDFEKENPNFKIKWIDIPYAEGEKRTLAAILTDNPPDLVNITPDFSLLLAEKKAITTLKKEDLEQYHPNIIETLKYNNEYYGFPFYITSAITLYNTDLTDKEIRKYDELLKFVPSKSSYTTMLNLAENDTLLKILNKYDINSYENINSEKSVKLFNKIKEIYAKGLIPKESITQTHRESLEKYMAGQLAYLVTGANFLNMIKENAPSIYKKTKVSPQLVGETEKFDYSLMNFVIPMKAKEKDGAKKFAQFLTNKENQLTFSKMTTVLPVNKYSLNDDYFKYANKNDIQEEARIISAKQLDNLQLPSTNQKNKKELNNLSANCIQEILINNKDAKEVLDKFSSDWSKL